MVGGQLVGVPCTYIHVDQGPFESSWMKTINGGSQFTQPLTVRLHNADQDDFKDVTVLGTLNSVIGAGMKTLVIEGASHGEYVGAGQWFEIDGERDRERITQSGYWKVQATQCGAIKDFWLVRRRSFA